MGKLDEELHKKSNDVKNEKEKLSKIIEQGLEVRANLYEQLVSNKDLLNTHAQKNIPFVKETLKNIRAYESFKNALVIKAEASGRSYNNYYQYTFFDKQLDFSDYLLLFFGGWIGTWWIRYRNSQAEKEAAIENCNNTIIKMLVLKAEEQTKINQLNYLYQALQKNLPLFEKLLYLYQASLILERETLTIKEHG